MTNTDNSTFRIPLPVAQEASRAALSAIERRTGLDFLPEVKGALAKHLTGILANAELEGGFLTHGGIKKQLRNQIIQPPMKRTLRKRWKGREEAA